MTTMRACVLHDYEAGPAVEEVIVDDPGPGEVRVRITASGICGSDLHLIHGRSNAAFLPAVLGHEGAGVVESVGADVSGVEPDQRVVVAMGVACGSCTRCASGEMYLCSNPARMQRVQGRMEDGTYRVRQDGQDLHPFVGCGTLAEYVVVPAAQVLPLPDVVPFEVGAIVVCGVLTGVGAVLNIAAVRPGTSALVIGCGGVGLSVVQACRISGASRIIAADANPTKLPLAVQLGATDVVDVSSADLRDAVRALAPAGVDYAFEVVGQPSLVTQAFELTAPGGTCVATATYPPGSTIEVGAQLLFFDRRLRGCLAGNASAHRDIPRILQLYRSGQLDLDAMVSERFPIDRVHDAIAATERGDVARAVISFS